MTNESQAKYDKRQTWVFAIILLIGLIGAAYWIFARSNPASEPPPVSPVATPTEVAALPPTPTPTSTPTLLPTHIGTRAPAPDPTDTPTATPSPTVTPAVTPGATPCSIGGDVYSIRPGDTLWGIWFIFASDYVPWPVWLEDALRDNWWLTDRDLIHPTGATGWVLWLPWYEVDCNDTQSGTKET